MSMVLRANYDVLPNDAPETICKQLTVDRTVMYVVISTFVNPMASAYNLKFVIADYVLFSSVPEKDGSL